MVAQGILTPICQPQTLSFYPQLHSTLHWGVTQGRGLHQEPETGLELFEMGISLSLLPGVWSIRGHTDFMTGYIFSHADSLWLDEGQNRLQSTRPKIGSKGSTALFCYIQLISWRFLKISVSILSIFRRSSWLILKIYCFTHIFSCFFYVLQ